MVPFKVFAEQKPHKQAGAGVGFITGHKQPPQTLPKRQLLSQAPQDVAGVGDLSCSSPRAWQGKNPFRAELLHWNNSSHTQRFTAHIKAQQLSVLGEHCHFDYGCSFKAMPSNRFPEAAVIFQAAGLHSHLPQALGRQLRAAPHSTCCKSCGGISTYSTLNRQTNTTQSEEAGILAQRLLQLYNSPAKRVEPHLTKQMLLLA